MTAQLAQLYNEAGAERKFEVILVGFDSNQRAMEKYMKKSGIPFPAIKIADRDKIKLTKTGDTGFLPNTVLIKPDGTMVTNDQIKVFAKLHSLNRS